MAELYVVGRCLNGWQTSKAKEQDQQNQQKEELQDITIAAALEYQLADSELDGILLKYRYAVILPDCSLAVSLTLS